MKKTLGIVLMVFLLLFGTAVQAEETAPIITEAHFYTGTLYYCDAEAGVVVLKNVNVMGEVTQTNTKTAVEAEYTELPVVGSASMMDQTEVSLSECNFYPDSEVRVLITRNAQGALRVVQLKFL